MAESLLGVKAFWLDEMRFPHILEYTLVHRKSSKRTSKQTNTVISKTAFSEILHVLGPVMLTHRRNLPGGGQDALSWNWFLASCEFQECHLMVSIEGFISHGQLGEERVVHQVATLEKKIQKEK